STLLATASSDHTVRLWNPVTRTPVGQPLTGHNGAVIGAAFSPDSTLLATASQDRTVRLSVVSADAR
ncbi:WD40 repeat domain-containing protein, partial [Streptomyces sp. NPDC057398]|uniref:WD40 repeat domain-containing protein n=1 Tax=Streptomyces sp. NPDC057398 TaxID=3346118 RepID=UPI0036B4E2EF